MPQIKDCLIVAAGKGTRLKENGDIKPLVELCGAALIEYAMRAAANAGVERFVVVTGYEADRLTPELNFIANRNGWKIVTAHNPDYELANGLSVLQGKPHLHDEFFLTMCDHVVDPAIYERLASANLADGCVALGVDYRLSNPDVDIDDVTKVKIQDGCIKTIGKELTSYDGYDTGVFRANANLFAAIETSHRRTGDCSISGGMKMLSKYDLAMAVDTGDARWIDVDSPQMVERAQDWIRSKRKSGAPGRSSLTASSGNV